MAQKRKKGVCNIPPEKRIKKGEVRNAAGGSQKQRFQNQLRKAHKLLTAADFASLVSALTQHTPVGLQALYEKSESNMMLKIIARGLEKAWVDGDVKTLLLLLDYVIGRPKEHKTHEHSGLDGGPIMTAGNMSDEEIAKELAAIRARRVDG